MADEEGWDDGSGSPDEEGHEQEPRRVRPLFRFRRNKNKQEEPEPQPEEETAEDGPDHEEHPARVRPVRVVKFIPDSDKPEPSEDDDEVPFAETELIDDEVEPTFAETELIEDEVEPTFVEAEVVEDEEEPTFAEAEVVEDEVEPTFEAEVVEDEVEPTFVEAEVVEDEEEPTFAEAEIIEDEAAFSFEEGPQEGMVFSEVVSEEQAFPVAEEGDDVPEVPFAVIEEVEREEVVDDGVSTEEEAEMSDDLQFRQEETPVRFEHDGEGSDPGPAGSPMPAQDGGVPAIPPSTTEAGADEKPHYHKFLKPDDDLVSRPQARGRPTGFDRDLESEAGEIDFGIDLIDPNDQRKKKAPKKGADPTPHPKKGSIGGHDSDGEVGTRELGNDIGVDYTKRRKRRL